MTANSRRTGKPKKMPRGVPFKKNEPGKALDPRINRSGRSKSHKEFTEQMQAELEPVAIERLRAQLDHGDPYIVQGAIKETLNRSRGRAPQPITGEGGEGPVNVESAEASLLKMLLGIEAKQKEPAAALPGATVALPEPSEP